MFFESWFQSFQYFVSRFYIRLFNVNFLKATRQRPILVENTPIFLIGRGADASKLTRSQRWLKQI